MANRQAPVGATPCKTDGLVSGRNNMRLPAYRWPRLLAGRASGVRTSGKGAVAQTIRRVVCRPANSTFFTSAEALKIASNQQKRQTPHDRQQPPEPQPTP